MSSEPNLFLEGEFSVTCLLLLMQQDSNTVTEIFCRPKETILYMIPFLRGGGGGGGLLKFGIGLPRVKAQKQDQHLY
jgi:hypothetical protein